MKRNWLSYMCMAALLSGALTSCNESSSADQQHQVEVKRVFRKGEPVNFIVLLGGQ